MQGTRMSDKPVIKRRLPSGRPSQGTWPRTRRVSNRLRHVCPRRRRRNRSGSLQSLSAVESRGGARRGRDRRRRRHDSQSELRCTPFSIPSRGASTLAVAGAGKAAPSATGSALSGDDHQYSAATAPAKAARSRRGIGVRARVIAGPAGSTGDGRDSASGRRGGRAGAGEDIADQGLPDPVAMLSEARTSEPFSMVAAEDVGVSVAAGVSDRRCLLSSIRLRSADAEARAEAESDEEEGI